MNYKIFTSFLLVVLFAVSTFAQSSTIQGSVQDSAGKPIAGATVVLRNKITRAERTSVTDRRTRRDH